MNTLVVYCTGQPGGGQAGFCDTRSVVWNAVCRELALEDLARARPVPVVG